MEKITSRKNSIITETAKLKMKKYRDASACFTIEGKKLFAEAVNAGLVPRQVFVCEDEIENIKLLSDNSHTYVVTREVYEKITNEKSPQGIMGVFECHDNVIRFDDEQTKSKNFNKINEVFKFATNGYIIIENVQDAGNVGTVIRTALALGINAVLCVGCADLYNPKTMRAAMGALFKMPVIVCESTAQAVELCRRSCKKMYAAALAKDSISIDDTDFSQPCAVMIGNEGNGLSNEAISLCDGSVIIPISEQSESLNAAVAAAIFMDRMRRR